MKVLAGVAAAFLAAFPLAVAADNNVVTVGPPQNAIIPGQTYAPAQSTQPGVLLDQAQTLLENVESMQTQLGGSSGTTATGGSCPQFTTVLGPGSSGAEVVQLQQFLATDPSIYPSGLVTGYYGSLTEAAVQAFQSAQGIVSSGSPSTTGYGQVGPKTAAAIEAACGGGTGGASTGPVGGFIQVSPEGGPTPLQISVVATVNTTNSCAPALYTVDYGDGSQDDQVQVPQGSCQSESQTFTHTYTTAGTYQVTLATGTHQSSVTVVSQ